ncbi:nonribosomal peptide synthase [Penicillium verrucosum]|uniref:nonribosomal peptide synthase n=1 Tax=Penicillium verrucosum TaxID=60171 RepID=UPI0025451FD5|nr:nonribosomal peptide synthase [Penicillium verrucosum]KAJ5923143.1 nonribosomal peptide synthase [Penicillium verrucosum]
MVQVPQSMSSATPTLWRTCVHHVIRKQAQGFPGSTAVLAWDGSFSYAELENLSSHLAVVLMLLGAQPEAIVPICMDKSRWTTVAILAVMKSGAAFTLLDPSYPPSRLQTICQEINCKFILTCQGRSEQSSHLAPSLVVEHLAQVCRPAFGQPREFPGQPDSALYVAFTSGSTGKPKGVVIEHQSYCSGAQHHLKAFGISRDSRILQFASYAFDVSLMETLSTLMAGACLCVMSSDQRTDPDLFRQVFESFQISHAFLTPSFARTIAWKGHRPGTITLILGGETMRPSDVVFYNKLGISLMNAYGPAECSVNSTVLSALLPEGRPNNIGFCTGAVAWIVDPDDPERRMPHGKIGELLLEGPIVGRGYLNNLEATRERIRAGTPGTIRTYLTGDLASRDTNSGEILIHGRKDQQVKIRGQRVELEEIENHLCDCLASITTEVFVERISPQSNEHQSNEQDKLIAFAVLPANQSTRLYENMFYSPHCAAMELFRTSQQRLKERVPNYMVPNTFIPLAMVPKVPSGKIDRGLLRATAMRMPRDKMREYNLGSIDGRATKEPPTTQKQVLLRRLYSEILDLPPELIGIRDTFLQLGGDSLLAIRLVGAARKAGLLISTQDILSSKVTVSEQAERAIESLCSVNSGMHATLALITTDTRAEVMQAMETQYGVRPQEVEDIYPCTALQEGMFAASIKNPGMYAGEIALQVQDGVDPVRLKSAWKAITTANPILRTRIVSTTKGFMQVVLLQDFVWEEPMCVKQSKGYVQEGLSSTNGSLVKFHYGRPSRELKLTIHHSIWDGWSLQVVLSQFEDAYQGRGLARSSFSPFVYHTQSLQSVEEFWATEFLGLNAPVFPALPSSNYRPSPTEALNHVIRRLDTTGGTEHTVATYIHLAWSLLVAHYTDSTDVLYGVTLSGRYAPVPDIETIVGPTIATVPLRVKVKREASFKSALDEVQDVLTRIIPHEQAGLPRISRCSADAARACNFQSQLIIESSGDKSKSNCELLSVSSGSTASGMSYIPFTDRALMIVFHPNLGKGTIQIDVTFDSSIISSTEVSRMMSQYENVLRQIYETPSQTPGDVQMASPNDLCQLQIWNQDMPRADHRCLPQLVLAQSTKQPQELAVCSWDGSWTYDELVSRSLLVSHHLNKLGVQPGCFVSICLERSKWSIAAIIAVHWCGGTCILLDPDHPKRRLRQITQFSGSFVMINSEVTTHSSGELCPIQVSLTAQFLNDLEDNGVPSIKCSPEDPAFIMFTSGSTGEPKGIVMSHRALSSSIYHNSDAMNFHSGTRALHFSSYAFDVSIYEIFTTLAAGGTVCVPSEFERKNCLAEVIERMNVNWAFLTPTTVQTISPSDVPSLTTLVLGGEAVTRDNADTWASGRSLINGYGPAEATICGVGPIPEGRWKPGVIGLIVGGLGWITEPMNPERLAAVGAIGELLLEGPFLAHGYLNLPDVTNRAFIKSPAWRSQIRSDSPSVVYRTGDLVKYEPDGSIQYMGRKDTRIKLRGQLIDLGEVETAVLRIFPDAVEVVAEVMRMTASTTATILIAWIKLSTMKLPEDLKNSDKCVAPAGSKFRNTSTLVQTRLREQVPSYLVPSMLLPVWRIPRTLTGKSNRRCLRQEVQALSPSEIQSFMVAPNEKEDVQNKSEELLRDIWADLLGITPDQIGRHDGFLLAGGDSITAMKMMAVARRAGFVFTVMDVLNSSPLSKLAATQLEITPLKVPSVLDSNSVISKQKQEVGFSSDANSTAPFPVTDAQEFLIKRYPWSHFRFSFNGNIDQYRLRYACDLLLRNHSILRTAFVEDNGHIKQSVQESTNNVSLRTIVTDDTLETFAAKLCDDEQLAPVATVDHPTLFTLVSNEGLDKHQFIIRLAHAQYDAVSLPRVLQDFETIFNGTRTVAASDFRQHLALLSQQDSGKSCEFWRTYLANSAITPLPSSVVYPYSGPFHRGDHVTVAGTCSLPLPAVPSEVTLATVVKAASCLVLAHFSGRNDIVLGQTVCGRNLVFDRFDRVVGPCTNYIPYRVVLNPSMTAFDYLVHAQAQHSRCLNYESISLSRIIKNCTNWAQTTEFTCIVQHQVADTYLDLTLDGNKSTSFSLSGRLIPSSEIWICSTATLSGLKIEVFGSSSSIGQESAELLASEIPTAVHNLLTGVHDPLFSVYRRNM